MSDIKLGEISLDPVAEAIVKGVNMKANSKANKEFQKTIDQIKEGTDMPVRFNPNTSEFDKAKKEAEKPIKTPVKLETEDVDLPLLGKTPIKLSIDKDSRTAIKKTLKDAEKASKSLIDSAARTVKKIGSANYLEELTKNEQQSVSNAVAKIKRNNPGISEDKLKTFEQNLTLDRRAKKTHDTLSENFRIPSSSSKAYGQEMYDAAITAAKIQAAVKIREGLHKDEGYTQFLSENDKKKNFNGSTLKLPDKIIDQIQNGLYEHFGVGKLGTALSSGGKWTGIQDRMAQSIDSFGAGLLAAVDASSGKRITKEFQARIDSAVKTAVGMSIDDAISHLSGTKGTKESKKALSLLDRKQDGEYEYSVADIYDILRDRTPTGKNATAKEDAVSGINYKGFSDLFAALQVYQRSRSSKLDKNHVKRLSELVSAIVSEFQGSTYNAQTVIDSINTSLDQAQIEAEKVAKEQPKIEDKSKPKKSSKKSSSTTPKKKQTGAAKVEHYIPNIEGNSTYAKLANQNYTTKSKEEALQKLSESFETWNDALPDTHEAYGLKYIYRRYMLEAYQMGASIDELSKFSLTDLSNKAPEYFVKMVEKAGEQFKVFADLYDYVVSINKSLLKKNTIKNLLDSIAKGQIAAKRKFGESLELTDGGDLIGISESYKPDFVKEFISLQKKRQQDLNKEIARVTGTESNINVLPEYYNSLLKLFEPSATPQIEEKKIKETAKTEPKKVEESKPKKAEPSSKTEESKKIEKKIEQKQDKTEEIEEPKYSFSPRLTKNNQKKHDSRFTGRLYDQKQLMDFASAPLNRSPKIKSNSGIFDKNGNYYVVSGNKAPDYVYKRIQYKPHATNSEKSSSLRSRQELTDFSKRPATEIPEPDNTEELLAEIDKQIKEELYVKPKRQRNRKKSKKEKADIDSVKRDLKKKNSVYKELQERANSTDATLSDMMAVSDAELNRLNAIKKARSKGVSEKDLKKILGSNAPSNDELEKAISEAQSKKISYSSATATYDKKTPNSYAEKQISQGPVPDFDQTRVRSHVDDSYKPKYKVVKKSPVIKTGPKIGYDNGKLYPTADVPDDFSGLKQLSQRESAAGKKLVKTYQDIDKSIITLTQTYEENEETGASGWKNSVSRYSDFKALGTEATKITNKILQQKADLDTEMSKPDDKRNQNKIKELKENIKANQADRREIADIARSIANDSSNDYKFSDFVDAVSKGSREQRNALNATKKTNSQNIKTRNFTDQYKEAIADVKELGKAYTTLQNTILNPKGSIYKKKDGKLGSSYEDSIDQQLQSIEEKEKKIESFNENVHNKNKTSPSKIADQKIYDSYEEELQKGQSQRGQFDDNLVSLLRSAYQTRSDAQNEMLKIIGNANKSGKINKAAYEKQQEKFEKSDYAYNLLKDKVSKRQGLFDTLWSYKDDRWGNIEDRNSILQSNFDTLAKQINDYVLSIEKAGKASDQFKKDFGGIQSDLSKNDPTQFKDSKEGMKEYLDFMTDIQSRFNTNKDFYENGFGKSSLDYEAIKNKLIKSENYDTKTNDYKSKVSGFVEQWNGIIDSYNSGDIEKMKEAEHAAASLISTMNDFYKESSKSDKYKKTTSKGTLVEDTVGKVQDINDAKQSLKELTDEMQLTNKISETIDTSTGKITQKFKDDSGNIVTITSNIDELNKALRTTQKIQYSGSGGSGSLLGGLKNLVSGNFKSIVGEIGSSVANVQILGQAFQQMKDGFNTFLDFNKGLTNISYTMDMSKEQLSSLGSSAVDMAKDLSMSLDNTMDIYQIYANMNTTSKEIQETAKPTAILSNLSGVDASTAADQVQGILQQFHMLEDGSTTAADASMHVVDVLDKISGAVGMDYAKGIKVMTDAVQASGQVAFDAGMSYEQLAAISAKVAERTREDGSSIGNALKTIITRTTKVGKMPQYADEVDNATLSNASESLHSVGIDVYNPDGSDRGIITVLSELKAKWDDLSDAQQAKIAFDVAATRQTSKFKSILDAFSESMTLAGEATTTSGNAEANQEKYMESFSGKIQAIKTQMDEFWLNFYNSDQVSGALDFVQGLTKGFTGLEEAIGPIPTLITAVFSALTVKNAAAKGLEFLVGKDGQASGLANAVG